MVQRIRISHWLPIITICPVNNLPDLIYVTVTFEDQFVELYNARKRIKAVTNYKRAYMEDIASSVLKAFPLACEVEVKLLTGRHVVTLRK